MGDLELKVFLNNHISSFCRANSTELSPKVIFIPISEESDIQTELSPLLVELNASDWPVFNTYGSFHHQDEKLYPILQLIREILFIDDNIVAINASLPKSEQIPQIGNYLIPEFLQTIPKIEDLYKLIAQVASVEEQERFWTENPSPSVPLQDVQTIPTIQNVSDLYEITLQVFSRVISDLFEVRGMIFIYNNLQESDLNSLKWLEYSARGKVTENLPLIILACYPEELNPDFIDSWAKSARFAHFIRTKPLQFHHLQPIGEDLQSINDRIKSENQKQSDAELLVLGAGKILEELIKKGIIALV